MITSDGVAKIMDFGLAKLAGQTKLTRTGSTVGTVAYMSPEQIRGEEIDQRADLFSFGTTLYEMLTGHLPFRGDHEAALSYSIANEDPIPVRTWQIQVPPLLERVIDRCLEKDREKRYQDAHEVISSLLAVQKEIVPGVKGQRKTARAPVFLGGAVAALVLIVLGYYLLRPKAAPVTEKSIAVLPFVDMSPQKDQEYFCDGMTDELINRLSNVRELKVPARTSVFTFKGKTYDIKDVGEKLNVQTVLEGSVQKSGDRLRIIVQLINVSDGYHLWSEKYDRELKDVFAVQDEISSAIVNALELKLTSQEQQKLSEHPIDNVKAYEYYLKADREAMRFDEKSLDTALIHLRTAVDIIGDNAYLYSGMAQVYSQYANAGFRQEDYFEKSEEYARKALKLKPDFPPALSILGSLALYKEYPRNHYDAIGYFKKALESNPYEIRALHGMENIVSDVGNLSMGLSFIERMERQDPLNPRRYVMRGFHYLYNCQFDSAMEQFQKLYQNDPTSPLAQTSYSQILGYNGKRDEAFAVISKMGKAEEKNVMNTYTLLLKYGLLNDTESALRLITPDFRKTCLRDAEWSYWVANRLSLAGAKKEAMDWLENAISRGFINYPYFECDPFLNNIRGEERFKKLMEHAKYEWEHFEVPE
jgi:TolB-like protein/Tfp pilus assembly protein PilF